MEGNFYAPPRAPVTDIESEPVTVNRDVVFACRLYWVSFGLSLVESIYNVLLLADSSLIVGGLIGAIIGAAIGVASTVWIVAKLKAGRNWMRVLVTILSALGLLSVPIFWKFYLTAVIPIYAKNPAMLGVGVLQLIANTWGIILLNVPSSRAWFHAMKRREPVA